MYLSHTNVSEFIAEVVQHYIICAVWASLNGDAELDATHDADDLSEKAKLMARIDCEKFVMNNKTDIKDIPAEMVGHDLWLSRNHHGAGFWDRNYEKRIGDDLTFAAQQMKEINLIVGDDNKLYFE